MLVLMVNEEGSEAAPVIPDDPEVRSSPDDPTILYIPAMLTTAMMKRMIGVACFVSNAMVVHLEVMGASVLCNPLFRH